MQGFIRKREVLAHPILICRLIGLRGLLACLAAHRGETFLAIVVRYGKG